MLKLKFKLIFAMQIASLLMSPFSAHCGWHLWISNKDECVDQYLEKAKCDMGVKVLMNACSKLYGETKVNDKKEDAYECILEEAIGMESDLAVRISAKRCFDKNN